MKNFYRMLFGLTILGIGQSEVRAQCDKTFNPPKRCGPAGSDCGSDPSVCNGTGWACEYIGFWDTGSDWGGNKPGNSDTACVPAGKIVYLQYAANEQVGRVIVSTDGTAGDGEIYISQNASLTMNGTGSSTTSVVDGEFELVAGSKIKLSANHTFTGTGEIVGFYYNSLIQSTDSTVRQLTISSGTTLSGAFESSVVIVNNGSVIADLGTIKLNKGGSGSGLWKATGSTGKIQILDQVTGSGTWTVDNSGAQIVVDAACACLEGNVNVSAGTLDVNQDFQTTGQLVLSSASSLIDVASGKTASFSKPQPGCLD